MIDSKLLQQHLKIQENKHLLVIDMYVIFLIFMVYKINKFIYLLQ